MKEKTEEIPVTNKSNTSYSLQDLSEDNNNFADEEAENKEENYSDRKFNLLNKKEIKNDSLRNENQYNSEKLEEFIDDNSNNQIYYSCYVGKENTDNQENNQNYGEQNLNYYSIKNQEKATSEEEKGKTEELDFLSQRDLINKQINDYNPQVESVEDKAHFKLNDLVLCEDKNILMNQTTSHKDENDDDFTGNQVQVQEKNEINKYEESSSSANLESVHSRNLENVNNSQKDKVEVFTPVKEKSSTVEMFSITFESSPAITIEAKPKEKRSKIDIINSQLRIDLVNDIFIPALEVEIKIDPIPQENFLIIKSENINVNPAEEIIPFKESEIPKMPLTINQNSSLYETPMCTEPEENKHEINKDHMNDSNIVGKAKKVNSVELNICDFNPRTVDNMGSLLYSDKNDILEKEHEELDNLNKSNPSEPEERYQKNIINSLDNICIAQYNINPNLPLDPLFFDILCINCYECVKCTEVDRHSEICVIQPDEEFCDLYRRMNQADEDVNAKIYKLYQSIKRKEDEIKKSKDTELLAIFEHLLEIVYDIFLNNNSIEELDASISKLNILITTKLRNINSNHRFSMLIYAKRVSQLVYNKLNEIEQALIIAKNNFDKDDLNESEFSESDNNDEEEEKKFQNLKLELVNLERQTMKSKIELEAWRKEAKNLEKMLRKPVNNSEAISDIVSDIVSYKDNDELDQMTNITGQTDNDQQDVGNMRDVNEVLAIKTEEDMKKYFFSIGLNIKFKYADKIKDSFSIDSLFEKAKKQCIPIHEWQKFIQKELNLI